MLICVQLNLLNNQVGERDKMRGLPKLRNEINKFNNTESKKMLDTIYHVN